MLVSPSLCFRVGLHQGAVGGSFYFSRGWIWLIWWGRLLPHPEKFPQNTKRHQAAWFVPGLLNRRHQDSQDVSCGSQVVCQTQHTSACFCSLRKAVQHSRSHLQPKKSTASCRHFWKSASAEDEPQVQLLHLNQKVCLCGVTVPQLMRIPPT